MCKINNDFGDIGRTKKNKGDRFVFFFYTSHIIYVKLDNTQMPKLAQQSEIAKKTAFVSTTERRFFFRLIFTNAW